MTSTEHIDAAIEQLNCAKEHLANAAKVSGAAQFVAQRNAKRMLRDARLSLFAAESVVDSEILGEAPHMAVGHPEIQTPAAVEGGETR